jgi:hypothetical protein
MWVPNWSNIAGGILGGIFSSAVVIPIGARYLGDFFLGHVLAKQKAKYDKELERLRAHYAQELERFRAGLERSVLVTRAQFETEFDAYKQVFEALGPVRLTMGGTRPMLSVSHEGETLDDRRRALAGRLRDLIDAQNKAVTVVENLLPFFPADIYRCIVDECLRASAHEILDIQTAGEETFTLTWHEEGARRWDEFLPAYNKVADMIRARISMLAILPRS